MHAWAMTVVAITGCAYQPSSFAFQGESFTGDRVRIGCLDLAIVRRPDVDGAAVMAYQFGNRCREPAMIDLGRLRVTGQTVSGDKRDLVAFDPKSEIQPLQLDGRWAGREAIAYPSSEPLARVCVDLASFAPAPASTWRCFDRPPHEPDEIERLVAQ
jgi:hypothetical protein